MPPGGKAPPVVREKGRRVAPAASFAGIFAPTKPVSTAVGGDGRRMTCGCWFLFWLVLGGGFRSIERVKRQARCSLSARTATAGRDRGGGGCTRPQPSSRRPPPLPAPKCAVSGTGTTARTLPPSRPSQATRTHTIITSHGPHEPCRPCPVPGRWPRVETGADVLTEGPDGVAAPVFAPFTWSPPTHPHK